MKAGGKYYGYIRSGLLDSIKQILIDIQRKRLNNMSLYISFDKQHPKVELGGWGADGMGSLLTIILENQFWDLEVDNYGFKVTLFMGKRYTLYIPFASIIQVVDPANKEHDNSLLINFLDHSMEYDMVDGIKEGSVISNDADEKLIEVDFID